jgi:hypothetical protein
MAEYDSVNCRRNGGKKGGKMAEPPMRPPPCQFMIRGCLPAGRDLDTRICALMGVDERVT